MKKVKKITLDMLMKEKAKYATKKDVKEEIYIPSLEASITVAKPDRSLCMEALKMEAGGDEFLVYSCVVEPNLKNNDLHTAYGCVEPTDIVDMLFLPGETAQISQVCLDLAGYSNDVTAVKDLKN